MAGGIPGREEEAPMTEHADENDGMTRAHQLRSATQTDVKALVALLYMTEARCGSLHGEDMIAIAEALSAMEAEVTALRTEIEVIGYATGAMEHQRDRAEAAEARALTARREALEQAARIVASDLSPELGAEVAFLIRALAQQDGGGEGE